MPKIQTFEIKLYDWAYSPKLDRQHLPAIAQLVHTFSKEFSRSQLPELVVLKDRIAQWGSASSPTLVLIDRTVERLYGAKHSNESFFSADLMALAVKISHQSVEKDVRELKTRIQTYAVKQMDQMESSILRSLLERKTEKVSWIDFVKCFRVSSLYCRLLVEREEQRFSDELERQGVDVEKLKLMECAGPLDFSFADDFLAGFAEGSVAEIKKRLILSLSLELLIGKLEPYSIDTGKKKLKLTALSMLVILGQFDLLEKALKLCPVNERSAGGYSAAHFAAMIPSLRILRCLWSHGADFEARTILDGTVWDLLRARGFAAYDRKTPIPLFRNEKVPLDSVEVRIGMPCLPDNIFSADALLELFVSHVSMSDQEPCVMTRKQREAYACKRKSREIFLPPVYVYKIEGGPLQGQWGIKATRPIQAGEYLGDYTGHVLMKTRLSTSKINYKSNLVGNLSVEAEKGGMFFHLANHGPSNFKTSVIMMAGTPRLGAFATRAIGQDQDLICYYGPDYFSETPCFELYPEIVDDFVTETKNLTNIYPVGIMKQDVWTYICLRAVNNFNMYLPEQFSGTEHSIYEMEVKSEHTKRILMYLFNFPERLMANIQSGKIQSAHVIALLMSLERKDNLDMLSLTKKQAEELILRIKALS